MTTSLKINRLIFFLSLLGVLIAIYVLQSFLRDAPIICVNSGCELVRKSPASYILSIPVPAFGLIGYSLITILSFIRTVKDSPKLPIAILSISIFGVLFVSWFTYTEFFIIKAFCTWCLISAIIMVTIFLLSLRSLQYKNEPNL